MKHFNLFQPSLIVTAFLYLCASPSTRAATLAANDIIAADIGTSSDSTDHAIVKIAPANGDRTLLSGDLFGAGATMNTPNTGGGGTPIASSPSGVVYYYERLATTNPKTIIKVDLATGNRTVVSGNGTGTGTAFMACNGIAWDLSTATLLFADNGTAATNAGIVRINLTNGARTQITGNGVGSGAAIGSLRAPCSSPSGTIYYFENNAPNTKTIVSVNPTNGARTVISGNGTGTGQAIIGTINNLTWDRSTSTLLATDPGTGAATTGILRIDPVTGNRTQVTRNGVGSGVTLNAPKHVCVTDTGIIYYYESTASGVSRAIVSVDATNGLRTVVSAVTPSTGSGTSFIGLGGIALVPASLGTTGAVTLSQGAYANGNFQFTADGPSGLGYVLQGSDTLTDWSDITTNVFATTPFVFTNSVGVTNNHRFYRVRLEP